MSFIESLLATLGGAAALVTAAAFLAKEWLKHQLDKESDEHKSFLGRGQLLYTKVLETRLPTYRELWALSGRIPASGNEELSSAAQIALAAEWREWYYRDGHGLVLSPQTSHLLRAAMGMLRKGEPQNTNAVRKLLSRLRTELKKDLHVYGEDTGENEAEELK